MWLGREMTNKQTTALSVLALFGVLLGACGPQEEPSQGADSCEEARTHLQGCFPDQEAQTPTTCTEESAKAVLSQSCDELQGAAVDQGKADGFCNPWFWWMCVPGSSEPEEEEGYSFNLLISVCQSSVCVETLFGENRNGAECGKITLHDSNDQVVATDYINDHLHSGGIQGTGTGFKNLDLPAGEYTAKLWRRDGEQAITTQEEPAEITVTLHDDGDVSKAPFHFEILQTEADAVRACSDVIGSLSSTCEGEPMDSEETEWGWFVKIEGQNSEGTYEDIRRAFLFHNQPAHSFSFRNVRAGTYTLTYFEMDVPGFIQRTTNNAKFEDYQEMLDDYATGAQISETIEITEDDIASEDLFVSHIDLIHNECR